VPAQYDPYGHQRHYGDPAGHAGWQGDPRNPGYPPAPAPAPQAHQAQHWGPVPPQPFDPAQRYPRQPDPREYGREAYPQPHHAAYPPTDAGGPATPSNEAAAASRSSDREAIDEIRDSLREFREALRELAENRNRRRFL